jgi:hypothetical protein
MDGSNVWMVGWMDRYDNVLRLPMTLIQESLSPAWSNSNVLDGLFSIHAMTKISNCS